MVGNEDKKGGDAGMGVGREVLEVVGRVVGEEDDGNGLAVSRGEGGAVNTHAILANNKTASCKDAMLIFLGRAGAWRRKKNLMVINLGEKIRSVDPQKG